MSKEPTKKQLALINSIVAIIQQFVSVVAGFIIPRLILVNYGSAYNGLISSISQVLSCIILLNGGVGGVTRAALYKALKRKDNLEISAIIKATESYLHKIGAIFIGIVFVVALFYPIRVRNEFSSWSFVFTLVLILSITNFAQYFFALAFQTLLIADQKQYVKSIIQIVALVIGTVLSAVLIVLRVDIRIVKLISAFCFVCSALYVKYYTVRKYNLDLTVSPNNYAIKQRWNAFAHTLANFVHSNTDIVILTFFTNQLEISVYSIYYLVLNGMKMLFEPINTSIEALLGNTMAQDSQEQLRSTFSMVERLIFIATTFVFSMCSALIVPFVMIYTKGIEDVNYYRATFAIVACTAEFLYCLRIPYQSMVQAFGHFKQTRNGAILEAIINITVSLALVSKLGLLGVAIGTCTAMTFRTLQYGIYTYKVLLKSSFMPIIRQILTVLILYSLVCFGAFQIQKIINISSWFEWIAVAVFLSVVVATLDILVSLAVEKKYTLVLIGVIKRKIIKKKG